MSGIQSNRTFLRERVVDGLSLTAKIVVEHEMLEKLISAYVLKANLSNMPTR